MAEAHPIELRQRLVEAYERGEGGYVRLARRFSVGEASVKRWVRLYRRQGNVAPQKKAGGTLSEVKQEELEAILADRPDANAGEITAQYNRSRRGKNRRHVSSIKRALYRAGYVVKKNVFVRLSSSVPMSSPSGEPSGGESAE
jgi:transposase-like protein